eukprot:483429_1
MKRVRVQQADNLATDTINPNPTKKRRMQSTRIRNKCKQQQQSENEYIELIDNYIQSIQSMQDTEFTQCINTICKDYETKASEISSQFKQTEIYLNNKYEYEKQAIHNEYTESIDHAKKQLIAKYHKKKSKHERLFKSEFKKHLKKDCSQKSIANGVSPIFEKDIYERHKLIQSKNENNNQFFDPILENKWSKVKLIAENDLQNDVHKLMFTQMSKLKIQDILSKFPRRHVAYKSDKHWLEIGMCNINGLTENNSDCFIIKVESPIAIQYERQCVMIGKVVTISDNDLWCKVRRNGDKCAEYSLCCVKIHDIEQEIVKIKLMD